MASPNILVGQSDRLLVIPRGYTLKQVKDLLKQEGYLTSATSFFLTASLWRYDPKLFPGQYRFSTNMSNWEAVKILRGGRQTPVRLTFSMARNKVDLVEQLTKRIGLDKEVFLSQLNDATQLAMYGFTPENVLTMFIPDTYEVYWTITAEKLFTLMLTAYQRFWNDARLNQLKQFTLTPIEISILASIVQSETNFQEDAAVIAGVYINRLKRNMRIGSCPTLLYALKEQNPQVKNRVLLKDTYIDSSYNSYRKKGLPPGPITLPSKAMIDAVLNYVRHDYLYFSAKEDFSGFHYFAKSYQEHIKNANKYRKALNLRKIMK